MHKLSLSKQRLRAGARWLAAALVATVAHAAAAAPAIAPAADTPAVGAQSTPFEHQRAVWQERRYSFAFLGFTTTYSCDGLADKLRVLLLAAGARADVKARSGACANGFGRPDKFARADLTFYVLEPADGAASTGAAVVDGVWRPVALASRQPRELGTGDCELVEQFKSNVLPLFATRNVEEHSTCVPHQLSGSVIDLRFDSLSATAPMAKAGAGPQ